nr:xylulose kinase-1 [Tanacetum cinerariifolium]
MKSWLVQKQTALGKDKSNSLIVDSLLKTIWSLIHHLLINEVLTIPGKMTTGVNTPRCDEDRLELMELTVFLLPKVKKVGIGVGVVDLQVSAVRHMLLLLVHKLLLFSLTNWCCSLSAVSEGFNQIIDFLNESSIKYALTVNPNIYVSCIKQFWTTVVVKKVNDVIRLQAIVDKKKVVVTEATIREALRLDDAEGRKFNFSKYIFDSLVRNVDSPSKFYMYPRFLQLMIRKQVGDLSTHTTKYTSPALTQKVFANMRRVGKGFSGVETPLFEGMLVEQQVVEEGDADENDENVNAGDTAEGDVSAAHGEVPTVAEKPSIPSPTLPNPPPQPSQDIPSTSYDAGIPMNLLQEVMDICTALTRRVEHLELDKVTQAIKITKLKQRVKKLERRNQERMLTDMDVDADVVLEEAKEVDDTVKDVQDNVQESAQDQGRTTESHAEIYKIDLDHANKIITEVVTAASETITAISTNITAAEAQVPAATTVVTLTAAPARGTAAPGRRKKGVVIRDLQEESTTSTIIPAETKSKDKGKGILVEELKRHLQIVLNEDDDVYTEATPLARKSLVKERFSKTKPKNFSDDFLLVTLGAMFEKPDIHAQIWKNQRSVHGPAKILNVVRLEVEEESEVSLELLRYMSDHIILRYLVWSTSVPLKPASRVGSIVPLVKHLDIRNVDSALYLELAGNGYDKKGTKSKQNRTKPSTKRKAWKNQQSKVKPDKIEAKETKKSRNTKLRD